MFVEDVFIDVVVMWEWDGQLRWEHSELEVSENATKLEPFSVLLEVR